MIKPKITREFLAELGRKAEAATPGKWRLTIKPRTRRSGASKLIAGGNVDKHQALVVYLRPDTCGCHEMKDTDLEYITFMSPPTALALKARVEELEESLEYYADEDNYKVHKQWDGKNALASEWRPILKDDMGERARQALKEADDD